MRRLNTACLPSLVSASQRQAGAVVWHRLPRVLHPAVAAGLARCQVAAEGAAAARVARRRHRRPVDDGALPSVSAGVEAGKLCRCGSARGWQRSQDLMQALKVPATMGILVVAGRAAL